MNLRSRLLGLVALATLLPAILIGLRFLQNSAKEVDQAVAGLSATAENIAQDLRDKIQGTAQLHYGLARARDLDTRDRAACSIFLSAVRQEYPQYTGILTIDPNGQLLCDSIQTGRVLDLNDRGYFAQARVAQGGVTLEPTFGRLTGTSVLQIAHPARSETGQLRFVLLASFNLTRFADAHQKQLGKAKIMLLDRNGMVLASVPPDPRAIQVGGSIAGTDLLRLVTATKGSHSGEVADVNGDRALLAVASAEVQDAALHIVISRPMSDLVADANGRLIEDLSIVLVVSLLLFGGVWALAEIGIRRQVGRIADMAKKLGRGDLSARIAAPIPKGELGELMTILNGAALSLEQQRAQIKDLDAKLRQSQHLEAVGQLTGGIAHDFNNMLTVILGSTETLSESLTDPQLRGLAEIATKAAERGAELTGRLLAFSRRQALDPKATSVDRLLAGMHSLLRRSLGEQIEIRMMGATGLWEAMIDAGQLENALLNLCLNARDAMPTGGGLTIETTNVDLDADYAASQNEVQAGPYVMIAVSDTGLGMDKATLARCFEPFYTTKEVGKGTGLGLSMVYGFIKQSKGHIRIHSETGHGTTIRLYLPRADAGSASDHEERNDAVSEKGNEKILLVEDEDLVREHVIGQLARIGYNVVATQNAREALDVLKQADDFDLLLTDVIMPGGMNGRQLAEEAWKLYPALRVLFSSGYAENAIMDDGRLEAGVHLLQKPYRRAELAAKVREVLDRCAHGS